IGFGVAKLAVWRAAEIVDRPVLMEEPRYLVRMPDEVGGELRRDHEVDRLVVRLRQIDEPPERRLREQLALRIRLEGNRDLLRTVTEPSQFGDEAANVPLGAAVHERHLRFTHENGPHVGHRMPEGAAGPDYIIA